MCSTLTCRQCHKSEDVALSIFRLQQYIEVVVDVDKYSTLRPAFQISEMASASVVPGCAINLQKCYIYNFHLSVMSH